MLPASLAACVPVFIATPTSAWASAGASLVPSPVMAIRRPPDCSRLIRAILSSGVASARKSSTPASAAIAAAVSGLSPVTMTVRTPMARELVEALLHAVLDDVLEMDDAEGATRVGRSVALGHGERSAAVAGDAVGDGVERRRHCAAAVDHPALDRVGCPLANTHGGLVVRFASSSTHCGLVVRFASSSRRLRLVAGASLVA